MKNKRVIKLSLISVVILFALSGCFRRTYQSPCDYLGSKWVYNGEYGRIEFQIDDAQGYYKGVIESESGKIYIELIFDTSTKSVFLLPLSEEEYLMNKSNIHMSQQILRGSFKCTEEEFIITSLYYNAFFGGSMDMESDEKIQLIFSRII